MLDFTVAIEPPEENAPSPPPAARDPFDVKPMRKALAPYEEKIVALRQVADDHQVVDEQSNKSAIEMASQAMRLGKRIEELRKRWVKPHQEFVRAINALCKVFTSDTDAIERGLKGKINAFMTRQRLAQLEAERRGPGGSPQAAGKARRRGKGKRP